MKTTGKHEFLNVSEIEYDLSNPRIARFLEMYEGPPTAEQIYMALGAGGDEPDGSSGPNFHKLKQSILTNGGVIQRIVVNRTRDSRLVCIEGNTRVGIYRSFLQEGVEGSWTEIPALVYDDLDEEDRDAVRLQAHLVGPRQWDPYSKAKYLSYLRNKQHFPFSKLVDYCGGNQKAVKESSRMRQTSSPEKMPSLGTGYFEVSEKRRARAFEPGFDFAGTRRLKKTFDRLFQVG